MKPDELVSTAKCVVDRQGCRYKWTVRTICRKNAEGRGIAEKARDIVETTDVWVVYNRMKIIEVKAVLQRVRICDKDRCE